jgi:hypothetical protein
MTTEPVTDPVDPALIGPAPIDPAQERLRRWRLVLGGEEADGTDVRLSRDDAAMDGALDAVYGERAGEEGGSAPTVARWLGDGDGARPTHRLTPWRTDWSSQTGASQLGILHGSNEDVPAFRWYEKKSGEVMVSNRPTSAAVLQRRAAARAGHEGLLTVDGASRGNLFTGGADELALVLSVAALLTARIP